VKKCTSCAKDLPDAAMHCVFCGTKQPQAPAPANAKTVMGWQATDVMKDLAAKGLQPAPGVGMPPPAAPPPAAPPSAPPPGNLGVMQTLAAPPSAPPPGNLGVMQTLAAPPSAPPGPPSSVAATMPGPQPPPASAAKTVFAAPAPSIPGPGAAAFPPAATMPAPSAYGPGPGAAAFPPAATMPAPSAYGGPPQPSPAASAATMFAAPAPTLPAPAPLPGAGMPPGGFGPGGFPGGPGPGGPPNPMGPGFGPGPGPAPLPGAGMGPGGMPPGGGYPPAPAPSPMPGAGMGPGGGYMAPAYAPPAPLTPPYLASRTAARAGAPREPYADGLRLVLIVFGALLLLAFAAPLALEPKVVFRWDLLSGEAAASVKFDHIYLAAAGVLALVFGLVPLANVPRGLLAAVLGLTPIAFHFVLELKDAPKFRWQEIVEFVGMLTLVTGLLLRHEYRSQMLPRLLATIGALCVLVPLLVPEGGDPPVKALIDGVSAASGKAKVIAVLKLYPLILALLSLLVWLPAPSSGGAKVLAWLVITTAVVAIYTQLLVAGHIGDVVKRSFNDALLSGWVLAAWLAFIGYGGATVLGKNLEHT
jgi:hypothetical protein